jgi:hypothetical protein
MIAEVRVDHLPYWFEAREFRFAGGIFERHQDLLKNSPQ